MQSILIRNFLRLKSYKVTYKGCSTVLWLSRNMFLYKGHNVRNVFIVSVTFAKLIVKDSILISEFWKIAGILFAWNPKKLQLSNQWLFGVMKFTKRFLSEYNFYTSIEVFLNFLLMSYYIPKIPLMSPCATPKICNLL